MTPSPKAHTPTPWTFKGEQMKHDKSRVIRDAEGMVVAFAADKNSYEKDAEVDANAAFIVQAVNAHEELVDGLKMAVEELTNLYGWAKQHESFVVSLGMWRRLDSMKQALAKASGADKETV